MMQSPVEVAAASAAAVTEPDVARAVSPAVRPTLSPVSTLRELGATTVGQDRGHSFYSQPLVWPVACNVCNLPVFGTVWRCDVCRFDCHAECSLRAAHNCEVLTDFPALAYLGEFDRTPPIGYESAFDSDNEDGIGASGTSGSRRSTPGRRMSKSPRRTANPHALHKDPSKSRLAKARKRSGLTSHHWVEVPGVRVGTRCKYDDQVLIGRAARCSKCHASAHIECNGLRKNAGDQCHPTNWVPLTFGTRNTLVRATKNASVPIIALINSKSGGRQGPTLLHRLRSYLGPHMVFDLASGGPTAALNQWASTPGLRVLVCGGDGTVAWVLQELDSVPGLESGDAPPVAVLPLGTGNDLARALTWGSGYTNQRISRIIRQVGRSVPVPLDVWTLTVEHEQPQPPFSQSFQNYFSIGFDAQIAEMFHKARESNPKLFTSRTRNKLHYVQFSLQVGLNPFLPRMREHVRVVVDDEEIDVPWDCHAILVLNVPSYGSGFKPWQLSENNGCCSASTLLCHRDGKPFQPQRIDDGLIEVIGLRTPIATALMQIKLSAPYRLAQGRDVVLTQISKDKQKVLAMQLDGEPYDAPEPFTTIHVQHLRQNLILPGKKWKRYPPLAPGLARELENRRQSQDVTIAELNAAQSAFSHLTRAGSTAVLDPTGSDDEDAVFAEPTGSKVAPLTGMDRQTIAAVTAIADLDAADHFDVAGREGNDVALAAVPHHNDGSMEHDTDDTTN